MNAVTRLASSLAYTLWRPILRRRLGCVALEQIDGVPLLVLPEVFNPAVYRTGSLLARAVASWTPTEPCRADPIRVLDLGTGSGVGAVFAARRGFQTVAVDVNPQAVRCARINALVHGQEERIDVRQGDLFSPVAGERFDLVLFNPPFFRGEPASDLDRAWRGTDVLERFAAGLPAALADRGTALLCLSTDGDGETLLAALRSSGFGIETVVRQDFGNEVVTVYAVRRAGP
ncbi:MAG TPA: methyltransferase [Thermoanaerobaculia bacterium]|nr:methyltransferase [Thermoanaerobaculia bacterium]